MVCPGGFFPNVLGEGLLPDPHSDLTEAATRVVPEIRLVVLGVVILIWITGEFGAKRYQFDIPAWPKHRTSRRLKDLVIPFFAGEILVQLFCETRKRVVFGMDVSQAEAGLLYHLLQVQRPRWNAYCTLLGHVLEMVEHGCLDCAPRVSGETRQ